MTNLLDILKETELRVRFTDVFRTVGSREVLTADVLQRTAYCCACTGWAPMLALSECPRDTDGISMVPALLGKTQKQHEYLYWEFHERGFRQAIRMGDWQGVRLAKGAEIELYDLAKDLGEENNIADGHPDVVSKIERLMETARTESKEFPLNR